MSRVRFLLLAASLLQTGLASALAGGPNGATVVAGSATVQGQGTASVVVNQTSQSAIINWNTFNIGAGQSATINMPSASSVELDRVTGGQGPSQILGSLTSNGQVFLVNPDGILFGKGAQVNVGSFLATTHDITNADFMAGRYNFTGPGNPAASIVNQGTITAQSGGFAALVAPGVRNTGTITATLGTIALASGNSFTLDFYGDRLIQLGVGDSIAATVIDISTGKPLSALVSNEGTLKANGGRVELTAVAARTVVDSVINNSGVIEANTIGTHNGMIILEAATGASKPAGAPTQTVKVSGKLSAAGRRKGTTGGTVVVTGENIEVSGAKINASGQAGGGTVLIGGDWGGGNPNTSLVSNPSAYLEPYAVPNASTVSVDAASIINASATNAGNGGKVIVWSDEATTFYGTILAKGGALSGDGGFVEVSGHQLSFNGLVDTSAPNGTKGTLLLDPLNATIAANPGNEVITVSSIENALATGNVVVTTVGTTGSEAGDITVAASLSWANANTLTLNSYRDITIDTGVTIANTGAGNLVLRADATGTGVGTVSFQGTGKVDFSQSTGTVSIFYNPADNPAGSVVNSTSYTSPTNYAPYVLTNGAVPNQLTAYMLVNSVYDLQNIQNNLSGDYALGTNIDASATASWNGGLGFMPIGYSPLSTTNSIIPSGYGPLVGVNATPGQFVGAFDGLGHTISNLTINNTGAFNLGLFSWIGAAGTVQNVGLLNGSLTAGSGYQNFGLLAGWNFGTITNAYATGTVSAGNSSYIGGLVGWNWGGTITSSHAAVNVTGGNGSGIIGGLVGGQGYAVSGSTITDSYATGNVTGGTGSSAIGGLVGDNNGAIIRNSYATGNVTSGSGSSSIGGLAGDDNGYWVTSLITTSYATGNVTGGNGSTNVGGLVGVHDWTNVIVTNSYWDTQTTGQSTSAGGTGQTTAQFKSGLPSGFDSTVWGISATINNGYPYLLWQVASTSPVSTTTFVPTQTSPTPTTISPGTGAVLNQNLNNAATFGKNIVPTTFDTTVAGSFSLPDLPTLSPAQQVRIVASSGILAIGTETVLGTYGDIADAWNTLNDLLQRKPSSVIANDITKDSWDILNSFTLPVPFASEALTQAENGITASTENALSNLLFNIFTK